SRMKGALLGVHAGDSLGATLEFMIWDDINRKHPTGLRDIIGGGSFGWKAGDATDDTDLTRAVLLAYRDEARHHQHDKDVTTRAAWYFVDWYDGRNWPGRPKGLRPQDVGGATAQGISQFKRCKDWKKSGAGEGRSGNGSLMRCIPIALFRSDPKKLVEESRTISMITHDDSLCQVSCVAYNVMVRALIDGKGVEEAWQAALDVLAELKREEEGSRIGRKVEEVERALGVARYRLDLQEFADQGPRRGGAKWKEALPFYGDGFVLESLKIAVAAAFDKRSLEEILVDVVRLGRDTDTNGAIAGGLLGARDGVEAIPERWREKLQFREEFEAVVDELLA
ncbi:ADP-ribosylation/Crystallin J1, partial [Podospora australis]